ncbi:MAG: UvrD-helicase domain-containing protein [Clostridiales bacterium]|nr:UvrD-helicase domain-containing protein [Clostridiales bacterium]
MALIKCPECGKQLSDRADFCPHCGLPSKYFAPGQMESYQETVGSGGAKKKVIISEGKAKQAYDGEDKARTARGVGQDAKAARDGGGIATPGKTRSARGKGQETRAARGVGQDAKVARDDGEGAEHKKNRPHCVAASKVDYSAVRNSLIAFDHACQTAFGAGHYITSRELENLERSFSETAGLLADKKVYDYCAANAHKLSIDMTQAGICLRRYESLKADAESHNALYIDSIVEQDREYFDGILRDIDPGIVLDDDQRRAVVADDDYCLLVAGAGAGKTTTMAAKVKYLVEKKGVAPEDIIVISYTNKAIDELKDRVTKRLGIPARICTFHAFAYDIVRKHSDMPPEVNYSAYNIIFEMLEEEVYQDKDLLRNLLLFMGYYFDLPEDALNYESLEQYHLARAALDYETLKSGAGEYLQKVMRQRDKSMRTITGEYLRSVQECQIANFMYLHSLDYEYEPVYEYAIPGARKKYTPDFIIRQGEHTAYLEHYAVSESGYSYVLTPEQRARYSRSIANKRKLHRACGTTLLETWSWYKDKRPILDHLREALEAEGFVLEERSFEEVYRKLVETSKDKYVYKMVHFLITFIGLFKTCGYDAGGFAALRGKTDNPRTLLFLDIAEPVYHYYMDKLGSLGRIDFEDMINDANFYLAEIEQQGIDLPYKYIVIDEFQDIARQRFNLTKRLSEITKAKVVAVGDDWQSIYAFAGSEIGLFTRFLELMGSGVEMKITHTYRNAQELIDIAGGFIQKNSSQIKKNLISPKRLKNPIVLVEFDDGYKVNNAIAEAAEKAIGGIIEEYGAGSSILVIGRYNFDSYKLCNTGRFSQMAGDKLKSEEHPDADITYMTAHSAKGLGFDNVVILNMFESKFGFPCQIEDDPIMKLVRVEDMSLPFAEERRLFYVALTRTKNRVYILAPQNRPSRFLIELVADYGIEHSEELNMDKVDMFSLRCPDCGFPLKYEFNKSYGLHLWLCTNEPEICDFMTNNRNHMHDIFRCDSCDDGYMIVKTHKGRAFYGRTNYNAGKCRNTKPID